MTPLANPSAAGLGHGHGSEEGDGDVSLSSPTSGALRRRGPAVGHGELTAQ